MQLTDKQKYAIIVYFEEGLTQREIAQKIDTTQATVSRVLSKYKKYGSIDHFGSNGRTPVVDDAIANVIRLELTKNSKTSLRKLAKSIEKSHNITINHCTIKNYLNDINLFAYNPISKPLLTSRYINLRFEASKRFMFMSEEDVKSVIFSDESKFNLFYSDGKVSVWREPGTGLETQHLNKTVKYGGGSVMVWGCFSYHGVGKLVFIDGIMEDPRYVDILSRNLQSSAVLMGLDRFIFQQDNDPKHTSKLAREYFDKKNITIMQWPPQSPDMNPIENLWADLKNKVAEKLPKNITELKEIITSEWALITKETCENLANSFKNRALKLYRAKGGHIGY